LEGVTIRCATRVVFNSDSLRRIAEQEGLIQSGIGVILGSGSGNGIDPSRFEPRPTKAEARSRLGFEGDEPIMAYAGRLTNDKGVGDLVSAFTGLVQQFPQARLLLVGSFEEGDPVDSHAVAAIQANPRISVLPWMSDLVELYSAIDLLVFPSHREGLPNVPLEAQCCGVPVVGYAASGTVDAVVDGVTGLLVPVGDVAALQSAITRMLEEPASRARMGAAGQTWVRDTFHQDVVWAALLAYYDSWLSAR
jgi:glycosyltransferase involved in cell wall biosynthesis